MATSNAKKAAEARAAALGGRDERFIEALEVERNGYVVRGNDARVKEVDAQLAVYRKALGVKPGAKVNSTPPEGDGETESDSEE